MLIPEIVSVAKAKAHMSELIKETARGKVFEVINHSAPVAIILSVERYKELLETMEDLQDSLFVLRARLGDYEKACGSYPEVMGPYWAEHPDEAPLSMEEFKAKYSVEPYDTVSGNTSGV